MGIHFCGRRWALCASYEILLCCKIRCQSVSGNSFADTIFFCSVSALSTSRLVSLCSTFFPNNPERHKRFLFVDWIRALMRAIVVLRYFIVNFIRIFLSFSFCVSFCLLFLLSALSTFNFSRNASFEVGNFTIGTKIDCEESHCKRCASTHTRNSIRWRFGMFAEIFSNRCQ